MTQLACRSQDSPVALPQGTSYSVTTSKESNFKTHTHTKSRFSKKKKPGVAYHTPRAFLLLLHLLLVVCSPFQSTLSDSPDPPSPFTHSHRQRPSSAHHSAPAPANRSSRRPNSPTSLSASARASVLLLHHHHDVLRHQHQHHDGHPCCCCWQSCELGQLDLKRRRECCFFPTATGEASKRERA